MAVHNGWPDDALGGLYPFEDHFARLSDGYDMHYIEAGRAGRRRPTFLLLHGNPTWSFLWRRFMQPLAALGRVVAVDHIGFGRSDHPEDVGYHSLERHIRNLEEFAAAARLQRVVPVVQDWGGPIGLGYAVRHQEDLAGLVVLNTWAFTDHETVRLPWWYKAMTARGVGEYLYRRRNLPVERYLPAFTSRRLSPDEMRAYRHPFLTPRSRAGPLAFSRRVPTRPSDPDWPTLQGVERGLPGLDVPASILWGAKDPAFPKRFAWAFHELLPRAETPVFLDGASHYLQEDAPEEIVAHITAWLRRR